MSFTPFQLPDAAPAASAAPCARIWDSLCSDDAAGVTDSMSALSASATQTNEGGTLLPVVVPCSVS